LRRHHRRNWFAFFLRRPRGLRRFHRLYRFGLRDWLGLLGWFLLRDWLGLFDGFGLLDGRKLRGSFRLLSGLGRRHCFWGLLDLFFHWGRGEGQRLGRRG
jgi:hypothetical protein